MATSGSGSPDPSRTGSSVRLRVDVAYDGAPFHGFARQPGLRTVQGELESALSRLLGGERRVTGAGRTDRGVHADGQVVHLDVDAATGRADRILADLGNEGLARRLDQLLGDPITVWAVRPVGAAFDARFSATERRYRYVIGDAPTLHPLQRPTAWHLARPLRVGAMRAAARHLLGEHDFASLCRAAPGGHTRRRIDGLTIARHEDLVTVNLRGPAFCHQQVRSLVGVLVEVGTGQRPAGWAAEVLAARDRAAAPRVAPPHGLTLTGVSYGRRWPASPPVAARGHRRYPAAAAR